MLRRRSSGTWGKCCLVVFAIVSSLCVCGPALYWKLKKVSISGSGAASACPLCDCDSQCPTPLPLFQIAPGRIDVLLIFICFFFWVSAILESALITLKFVFGYEDKLGLI